MNNHFRLSAIMVSILFVTVYTAVYSQTTFSGLASEPDEIFIWPDTAPGSEQVFLDEEVIDRSTTKVPDRSVSKISKPSLFTYLPKKQNTSGAAVIICPGGGYQRLSIDREGHDFAQWFVSLGVTAFVLKYRLPGEGHRNRETVPLQDAQRAIRLIRGNASLWGIDTQKIGVMGSSAGGHLASTLATQFMENVYEPVDSLDTMDCKPNFVILMYPVISMQLEITHHGSRRNLLGEDPSQDLVDAYSNELHVTPHTPPVFIVQAHNDRVSTENAVRFYLALKKADVTAEMHIFRLGGHGFGLKYAKGPVSCWPNLCRKWLESLDLITD
jgi:acetyl esterase/lipase